MFIPKKVKFRKWQTKRKNLSKIKFDTRGLSLAFGSHGVKSQDYARVTPNQLEAGRRVIARHIKKTGKMWVRVFPDRPFTKKPAEVKMGKGKGNPEGYCAEVRPGRIVFELDGLPDKEARDVLRKAAAKLPVRTKIITR